MLPTPTQGPVIVGVRNPSSGTTRRAGWFAQTAELSNSPGPASTGPKLHRMATLSPKQQATFDQFLATLDEAQTAVAIDIKRNLEQCNGRVPTSVDEWRICILQAKEFNVEY